MQSPRGRKCRLRGCFLLCGVLFFLTFGCRYGIIFVKSKERVTSHGQPTDYRALFGCISLLEYAFAIRQRYTYPKLAEYQLSQGHNNSRRKRMHRRYYNKVGVPSCLHTFRGRKGNYPLPPLCGGYVYALRLLRS